MLNQEIPIVPLHMESVGKWFPKLSCQKLICKDKSEDKMLKATFAFHFLFLVQISERGGEFVCLRCGKKFGIGSNARRHYRLVHLPQSQASCHICHKVFKNSYQRDGHRSQVHGITKSMLKDGELTQEVFP